MIECNLSTFFAILTYTITNSYAGHPFCQEAITLNTLDSNQSFHWVPIIMPTHSRELKKHRKEEEAMAAAMLQKEKEAAERLHREEESKVPAARASSTTKEVHQTDVTAAALSPVVSPSSAPNLTSLLTGHVGQESETVPENGNTLTATDTVADEIGKSPKKKKLKKSKSNKEDYASKRDCSGS
jgi:hypothetical protein